MSDNPNRGPAHVMASIKELLDDLASGRVSVADAERIRDAAHQAVKTKAVTSGMPMPTPQPGEPAASDQHNEPVERDQPKAKEQPNDRADEQAGRGDVQSGARGSRGGQAREGRGGSDKGRG